MKFKIMLLVLLVGIGVVGCASAAPTPEIVTVEVERIVEVETAKEMSVEESSGAWGGDVADNSDASGELSGDGLPRMIIYNADISLVVKDTVAVQEAITQKVGAWGGYISNVGSYAYDNDAQHINMTLRIPAENFNAAMTALRDMALEVSQENIHSQDVTQEYVDLESRLGALEAKAERLEALMEQAEDTEAVLDVYEHLSATQMEIEQTKGRMRYLDRSAAMATIEVQLVPDELSQPVEIAGWRPRGTLKRAVEALIEALQFLVDALIWLIVVGVPIILFIAFVLFVFIKVLGLVFKRRRKASPGATPTPGRSE